MRWSQPKSAGATLFRQHCLHALAQRLVRRHFGNAQSLYHGALVERRAANEEGHVPAPVNGVDGATSKGLELGQAQRLIGVAQIEQVVGDLGAFGGRGLGRADVHAAVKLAAVRAEDFTVEALGPGAGSTPFCPPPSAR